MCAKKNIYIYKIKYKKGGCLNNNKHKKKETFSLIVMSLNKKTYRKKKCCFAFIPNKAIIEMQCFAFENRIFEFNGNF